MNLIFSKAGGQAQRGDLKLDQTVTISNFGTFTRNVTSQPSLPQWQAVPAFGKTPIGLDQAYNRYAARELLLVPSAAQTLLAATAISADAGAIQIKAVAARLLTAAPTIAAGIDGQLLKVTNVGGFSITLQDLDTLASSNLRLFWAWVELVPGQILDLMYSSLAGCWFQLGPVYTADPYLTS